MEPVFIEPTRRTPLVHLDPQAGVYTVEGHSISEDPLGFYTPLIKWVEQHGDQLPPPVVFNVKLEDLNTGSLKCWLYILKALEKAWETNPALAVNWFAEDDDFDMQEIGEDFQNLVKMPVHVVHYLRPL